MPDRDHSRSLASDLLDGAGDTRRTVHRDHDRPGPARRRWRKVLAVVGGLVAFTALTLGLVLLGRLVAGAGDPQVAAGRPVPVPPVAPVAPADNPTDSAADNPTDRAGPDAAVPGYQLSLQATRADSDCAVHSYGRTREFFLATRCAGLQRGLYTGIAEGVPVVISVSTVEMPDGDEAAALRDLVDTSGTGNVSDLLREGALLPGGPSELDGAGYASARDGASVVIVETAPRELGGVDGALLDRTSEAMLPLGR